MAVLPVLLLLWSLLATSGVAVVLLTGSSVPYFIPIEGL